jgi:hypothetical protein
VKRVAIDIASAGTSDLVAAVSGKRITVHAVVLTLASESTAQFLSAANALTGVMTLKGVVVPMSGIAYLETAIGEALRITVGAAADGFLVYDERD